MENAAQKNLRKAPRNGVGSSQNHNVGVVNIDAGISRIMNRTRERAKRFTFSACAILQCLYKRIATHEI